MRRRELTLHYQPKIDIATGLTTSVEALVRWRHRGASLLRAPEEFVPQIEQSPVLGAFNDYVLSEAIQQAAKWRDGGSSLQISVNVPLPCVRPQLVETLSGLLQRHALPTDLIQLEITEGGIPAEHGLDHLSLMLANSVAILDRIREMGVTIALDDFGVAHSNLARLVALPVDVLKIDRSFVIPMLEDDMRQEVVRATISLAHKAGLWVVAEGVETQEHMRRVSQLGADCAQGYWLARPMPARELAGWLGGRERRAPRCLGRAGSSHVLRLPPPRRAPRAESARAGWESGR
jgi:EAL domain-containing protein (putative c-di-GMP-specific phosphodiesterase class I)